MIIQTISYCRTVQAKQYEPVKIEVSGVPGEGQTAADAFTELMGFVDGQIAAACASTNGAAVGTAKSSEPPLKGKGKTAANPSTTKPAKESQTSAESTNGAEPPFTPNKTTNGKAKPAVKVTPTKSQEELRAAFDKEVGYTMESESLEELATRFIDLTDMAKGITFKTVPINEYQDVMDGVSDRFQQLDGNSGADPDSAKVIIARGKAERQRIAHALQDAANSRLQEAAV